MINDDVKARFFKELEKNGSISYACAKVGIVRATYYRWMADKRFKKLAVVCLKLGRENTIDVAEYALVALMKEKNLNAIKYYLSHNDPRYRQKKESRVTMQHITIGEKPKAPQSEPWNDLMHERQKTLKAKVEKERQQKQAEKDNVPPISLPAS